MTELIPTHRDPGAHERADPTCPDCGARMTMVRAERSAWDADGHYTGTLHVYVTWRCHSCKRGLMQWENGQ